eukprot:4961192-Prymnesium_polylepis.1
MQARVRGRKRAAMQARARGRTCIAGLAPPTRSCTAAARGVAAAGLPSRESGRLRSPLGARALTTFR